MNNTHPLVTIPMKKIKLLDGNYLYGIKARIFNQSGYMIIDTGALFNVLDDSLTNYEYKAIPFINDDELKVAGISSEEISNVIIRDVGNIFLSRNKYYLGYTTILPLLHIKEKFEEKYSILGLLGNNFFKEHNAIINYHAETIKVNKGI